MEEKLQIKKFTLGKQEKIKKNSFIKKIICNGNKYRTRFFDCFYIDEAENKIAVIVPKRKIKLATDRNYLKRRMREAYRLNKYLLVSKKFHMVFIYRSQEKKKSFREIEACMIDTLSNLDVKK